jgi:hypothetical protein
MGDRNGAALSPGDRVRWYALNGPAVVPATVVREVWPSRYLIRIDPRPAEAVPKINVADVVEQNMLDHGFEPRDAVRAARAFKEVDVEKPIEVTGAELELTEPGPPAE